MQPPSKGNHSGCADLILRYSIRNDHEAELVMNSLTTDDSEPIDRKTSRSICDAVGERLQQNLHPDSLYPSSHLDDLMDELRNRDSEDRLRSSN
jgi:hypothetical protein